MAANKIIVLRFSAMGDVAMVAAVLKELSTQNPTLALVMVSRQLFEPFFKDIPKLSFHAIEPKKKHKGIFGLYQLFKELKSYQPLAVADLHDNLRSRIICSFFRLSGLPIKRIDKGRKEKAELVRKKNKVLKPLKLTVERYADVFRLLNFKIKLTHKLNVQKKKLPNSTIALFDNAQKKIGISPFAQHIYKVYPLQKMEILVADLSKLGYQIFLFGGGESEKRQAETWQDEHQNVTSLIGKLNLTEELSVISNLDLMLSMDSAGMHLASLMGIKVVSIWGPTHPYAGFLGYGQTIDDCIQIDHPSRPSSIYGNKPCICDVDACINMIEPQTIIDKIRRKLTNG